MNLESPIIVCPLARNNMPVMHLLGHRAGVFITLIALGQQCCFEGLFASVSFPCC
jgi:hypothetical protein